MLTTDAENLYLVISAREMNSRLSIIAKAMDEKGERRLKQGGASQVISPYQIASYHMLHAAVNPNILKYLELGNHQGNTISMLEILLSEKSAFCGHSLGETKIRKQFHVAIVAVKRASGEVIVNPEGSEVLQRNDVLVTSGLDKDLLIFAKKCEA